MSNPRNGDFKTVADRIEDKLKKTGFSRAKQPTDMITCKAKKCHKRIHRQDSRAGYCLACVKRARHYKMTKKADEVFAQRDDFGVF